MRASSCAPRLQCPLRIGDPRDYLPLDEGLEWFVAEVKHARCGDRRREGAIVLEVMQAHAVESRALHAQAGMDRRRRVLAAELPHLPLPGQHPVGVGHACLQTDFDLVDSRGRLDAHPGRVGGTHEISSVPASRSVPTTAEDSSVGT